MHREASIPLAVLLGVGAATAFAQSGDLSRVTMRVLDEIGDVDAVVLALDANGADGEDAASPAGRDAAADDGDRPAAADDERRELRERDELHDVGDDERGEGRLEDRDVERPAVPPPAAP